jgi:hypothetical protein
MRWVKADDETPRTGVDVYVKTVDGCFGVAKYWDLTHQWLTKDERLKNLTAVSKWKYSDAK